VNFDVLKSPIRSIQRSGRTGRKRDGRVVFLVSKGAEKRSFDESENNKKKIARVLQASKNTFEFCSNVPMWREDPVLLRQKMTKSNFRMSQVGGVSKSDCSHAIHSLIVSCPYSYMLPVV
jgi:Fanconi anemia group M protein